MFAILWHAPENDGSTRAIGPFASDIAASAYIETDPDLKSNPGACILPLDAPAEVLPGAGQLDPQCGCHRGVLIMNGSSIERCDDCRSLESDDEAIEVVRNLLVRHAEEPAF